MRIVRTLGALSTGAVGGFVGATVLMKRVLVSRGDSASDEVSLMAILDGIELKSRAAAFRGGSLLAWLGGIAVDLREATLAPDAHLSVHAILGGIAVRVPPGVRVESNVRAFGGGVAVEPSTTEDSTAPRLVLDGFSLLGGIAVGARAEAAFEA